MDITYILLVIDLTNALAIAIVDVWHWLLNPNNALLILITNAWVTRFLSHREHKTTTKKLEENTQISTEAFHEANNANNKIIALGMKFRTNSNPNLLHGGRRFDDPPVGDKE